MNLGSAVLKTKTSVGEITDWQAVEVRLWLILALAALAVAGALALGLALARTPGIQDWLPSGPAFFHKALVTHVVFSFQVWLLALAGAISALVSTTRWPGLIGLGFSLTGCVALLVVTLAGWGEASLNNYVPVLDHPLYLAGLATIAAGIAVAVARPLIDWRSWSLGPVHWGAAMMAVAFFVALGCFASAAIRLPGQSDGAFALERLFWGGGHVLQFVNTALVMLGWLALVERIGPQEQPPRLAKAAFALLALGACGAVIIEIRFDPAGLAWRQAYTQMLWYFLPLPPLVLGAELAWRCRGQVRLSSVAGLSLTSSLAVFALGGGAGFALGVADTRTPSHYHAMIGGVNLALMGVILAIMLPSLDRPARPRPALWSLALYGGGQVLHALGFYLAGLAGIARKTAGAEQGLDDVFKLASMGLVGLGGAIAVLGGVLFVVHVLTRLVRHD